MHVGTTGQGGLSKTPSDPDPAQVSLPVGCPAVCFFHSPAQPTQPPLFTAAPTHCPLTLCPLSSLSASQSPPACQIAMLPSSLPLSRWVGLAAPRGVNSLTHVMAPSPGFIMNPRSLPACRRVVWVGGCQVGAAANKVGQQWQVGCWVVLPAHLEAGQPCLVTHNERQSHSGVPCAACCNNPVYPIKHTAHKHTLPS